MKITMDKMLEWVVKEEYYRYNDTTLTMCFLTLKNGIIVTGESACVDPTDFNAKLGEKLAHSRALDKCWSMFGFQLASDVRGYTLIEEEDLKGE